MAKERKKRIKSRWKHPRVPAIGAQNGAMIPANRKLTDNQAEAQAKLFAPRKYNRARAKRILKKLEKGESLTAICRDKRLPSVRTIYYWMDHIPAFKREVLIAKNIRAHALADDTIEIADSDDEPSNKTVRIKAYQWLAGKTAPSDYGEQSTTTHVGPGGGPIQFQNLSDDELSDRLASLLQAVNA